MFANSTSAATLPDNLQWSVLFARKADRDPDFDESLDDEFDEDAYEDSHNRPPSRRPLIWILILFLLVGGGYLVLKSGMFGKSGFDSSGPSSEKSDQPLLTTQPNQTSPLISAPTPLYREGQSVSIISSPGFKLSVVSLSDDPSGTKPGPAIQSGESLTVLDGELINKKWIYHVRTASGKTGWIAEQKLQAQPSR